MDKLGKIHRHHRKEHLNLSKIAKFENDMSNVSEYIALKIFFSKIAKFENDMSNASKYIALKIFFSKIAKFENDMSNASEYIALKIYRRLYGGGQVCVPTKCLQNFVILRSYIFVSFSTNPFQTKQFY